MQGPQARMSMVIRDFLKLQQSRFSTGIARINAHGHRWFPFPAGLVGGSPRFLAAFGGVSGAPLALLRATRQSELVATLCAATNLLK